MKLTWVTNTTHLRIVILPDSPSNLMASQIKRLELNFPNTKLFRCGILCWLMLNQSLKSIQERVNATKWKSTCVRGKQIIDFISNSNSSITQDYSDFFCPRLFSAGTSQGPRQEYVVFNSEKWKIQINQENEKLYSIWLIRLLKYNSVKRRFLIVQIKIQVSTFSHRPILSKLKHNLIDQETRSPINKQ